MAQTVHWGPGHIIADRYKLEQLFGQGGMGSVWRAEHLTLRSPVAIKLLDPAIAEYPEILDRFMREAQSAAALRSMHVVQIFDYGVDQGVPYIAMELLSGESLSDRIKALGRLSPGQTARVIQHIARAISKAHAAGIVHRDLKPENVFLVTEEEEVAKVLDFGIAKVADPMGPGSSSGAATRTGALLGTPYYMSPEQARGTRAVDHRTDLWAMAVIAYECLLGSRPFNGDAIGDLVVKICTEDPPIPSQFGPVPTGFDPWFAKGVAREPEQRYQSAEELSDSLCVALGVSLGSADGKASSPVSFEATQLATGDGLGASSSGASTLATAEVGVGIPKSRPPVWAVALGVVALVVAVIGSILTFGAIASNDETDEATPDEEELAGKAAPADEPVNTPAPPVGVPLPEPEPLPPEREAKQAEPEKPKASPKKVAAPKPRPVRTTRSLRPKPTATAAPTPARTPQPAATKPPSGAELFSDRK